MRNTEEPLLAKGVVVAAVFRVRWIFPDGQTVTGLHYPGELEVIGQDLTIPGDDIPF